MSVYYVIKAGSYCQIPSQQWADPLQQWAEARFLLKVLLFNAACLVANELQLLMFVCKVARSDGTRSQVTLKR